MLNIYRGRFSTITRKEFVRKYIAKNKQEEKLKLLDLKVDDVKDVAEPSEELRGLLGLSPGANERKSHSQIPKNNIFSKTGIQFPVIGIPFGMLTSNFNQPILHATMCLMCCMLLMGLCRYEIDE